MKLRVDNLYTWVNLILLLLNSCSFIEAHKPAPLVEEQWAKKNFTSQMTLKFATRVCGHGRHMKLETFEQCMLDNQFKFSDSIPHRGKTCVFEYYKKLPACKSLTK